MASLTRNPYEVKLGAPGGTGFAVQESTNEPLPRKMDRQLIEFHNVELFHYLWILKANYILLKFEERTGPKISAKFA